MFSNHGSAPRFYAASFLRLFAPGAMRSCIDYSLVITFACGQIQRAIFSPLPPPFCFCFFPFFSFFFSVVGLNDGFFKFINFKRVSFFFRQIDRWMRINEKFLNIYLRIYLIIAFGTIDVRIGTKICISMYTMKANHRLIYSSNTIILSIRFCDLLLVSIVCV